MKNKFICPPRLEQSVFLFWMMNQVIRKGKWRRNAFKIRLSVTLDKQITEGALYGDKGNPL